MKKFALFVLLTILPAYARGQHSENDVLVVKEIRDGVVCESCLVTMAGSIGSHTGQISFLTPNHHNQFLYKDSTLTQSFTTEKLSRFFVAMGQFSLDFYPYTSVYKPGQGRSEIYWDFKKLEFRTAVNGQVENDWTVMGTLKADPDFYIGHATLEAVNDHSKGIQTTPAENYHAGKFDLRLNDSLTVEIRDNATLQEVYRFSIIRVRSVPDYFSFAEFPSDQSFEEILNTQINKMRTEQGPQVNHFEIEGGHSAFLRFANDEQYYFFGRIPRNSGIEYALDKPENWKPLGGRQDLKFTNGYTYIYLDKPEPGSKVKIFLRYKHQPESVHEVTVDVKHLPRHPGWVDAALIIVGVIGLAFLAIFLQKQRHKMQLARLNRKKNEVENQLQLLSGQLNPHFLFNSLNAVQSLIRQNDPEAANQYITEVATFMRTIMDSGRKELVSLAEEIAIEEKYIALEQKRKAFSYTLRKECNHDLASIDFPPLLLQPIIENSIRHGLADAVRNPSLTITVRCEAANLILTVADNGIGFDASVKTPGHGLSLTSKRIALLNEKLPSMQITLQTRTAYGTGTVTEIRLSKWLS